MNIKEKIELYEYCNELFEKYEEENPDYIIIEDHFGDEVMEVAGRKYGVSLEEAEEIYADVQILYVEAAVKKGMKRELN